MADDEALIEDAGFNPAVFKWARESAGLSVADAALALKMKQERLEAIEHGEEEPSRSVLLRMSNSYRRSLLVFYLPEPPRKANRGKDFRMVVADSSVDAEAEIDALMRDVQGRQNVVQTVLVEDEEAKALDFINSMSTDVGVEVARRSIMERLRIERQEFRAQPNAEQAFTYLREKVEAAGVFVLLLGNLGSYHSAIPVEAFRGFAIADPVAPFVVINDQDAKTAWSFTLMHEVVHLWLGATGVSGGRPAQGIEQFCNEVAAEILLPSQEVARVDVAGLTFEELLDLIATQATSWRVSRQMLAYALLRSGRIGRDTWQALDSKLRSMWAAERQREKEVARGKKGGPNYYVIRRHRLGRAMLDFAGRSLRAGYLSPAKAAQVLGVNPRSVFPLLAGAT